RPGATRRSARRSTACRRWRRIWGWGELGGGRPLVSAGGWGVREYNLAAPTKNATRALIFLNSLCRHDKFVETRVERISRHEAWGLIVLYLFYKTRVNRLMGSSREMETQAARPLEGPPFDPRAVANLMLDVAETNGH